MALVTRTKAEEQSKSCGTGTPAMIADVMARSWEQVCRYELLMREVYNPS